MSLTPETVDLIKVTGIVGGLLLAAAGFVLSAVANFRNVTSRRLSNYLQIIKSHRDLWKITLDKPERYARILQTDPDLHREPISNEERRFVNLLLLHVTSAYAFTKYSDIVQIEQMKEDVDEVLAFPLPRSVWLAGRHFFNQDFIEFVEQPVNRGGRELADTAALNLVYSKRWRILVLTSFPERLIRSLSQFEDKLLFAKDATITADFIEEHEINLIICFGYGELLSAAVLKSVVAINLHCGLLPHDRGSNPHLWSILNEGPRGASIHYIDEGVNTGDLIAQREVDLPDGQTTFQSSFEQLVADCASLFAEVWPTFRAGQGQRVAQSGASSMHTLEDQAPIEQLLSAEGRSLSIDKFRGRARLLLRMVRCK